MNMKMRDNELFACVYLVGVDPVAKKIIQINYEN